MVVLFVLHYLETLFARNHNDAFEFVKITCNILSVSLFPDTAIVTAAELLHLYCDKHLRIFNLHPQQTVISFLYIYQFVLHTVCILQHVLLRPMRRLRIYVGLFVGLSLCEQLYSIA